MVCKKQDICVVSGDDEYITVNVDDSNDITDYTWYFTVKPSDSTTTDDSDALLTIDQSDVDVSGTTGGSVVIPISQSSTVIEAGTYKYDIQYVKNGDVRTMMYGSYIVINDVTKRSS